LAAGDFTSVALTKIMLARAEEAQKKLNLFVRIESDLALAMAAASDARRAQGESIGILDGIPYTLKDVYATTDSPTTASSRMLTDWVAPYDATVYRKLRDAGAVMIAKANTDEFTMGASTETSAYGVSANPWDASRVSGGSSGGSAAAVAAEIGYFSIGTDTGGSIRQPAAFCGVTGMRPTYGRVSRWGELAMASSLDQTGPITRTMRDAAIVLEVLAGVDELDATSSAQPVDNFLAATEKSVKGMRIGVPAEFFGEGVMPAVETKVREALAVLESQGAELVPVSLPNTPHALAVYYVLCPAEVASNMARYDGIRYGHSIDREGAAPKGTGLIEVYAQSRGSGFGAEVQRRIILGNHVLSAGYADDYYYEAERVRAVVQAELAEVFASVDVLASPVSPHIAFPIGSQVDDPLAMYKEDVLTVPVNVAGVAAVSVPCGFVQDLPVGLQLISDMFCEHKLFTVGAAYQAVTDYHEARPAIL
jgi:aspartyl-tRNA(Asn)/glutamyl-tRNA(Gln) amidotransferase subunit A